MAESSAKSRRRLGIVWSVAGLAVGWMLMPGLMLRLDAMVDWDSWVRIKEALVTGAFGTYAGSLFAATLAVPAVFAWRLLARAAVRAGRADPLARLRASPRALRAVSFVVPAVTQALVLADIVRGQPDFDWAPETLMQVLAIGIPTALLGGLVQLWLSRAGLRALLAPLFPEGDAPGETLRAEEIRFSAIAVTPEARAAVAALAVVSVAMAYFASVASLEVSAMPVLALYGVLAAAAAVAYRRASRIRVGLDGVYVSGTSRARFWAYRDLDAVEHKGSDIVLSRGGRVVLRLQLHSDDVVHRAAIAMRIEAAIGRAKHAAGDAGAGLATSVSPEALSTALLGGGDYRMPAVGRDALWSLVEGTAVDPAARAAAAQALARTGEDGERTRLRVAAAQVADPKLRVALEELAAVDDEGTAPAAVGRARPA